MLEQALSRVISIPDSTELVEYTEPDVIVNGQPARWEAVVRAPGYNRIHELRSPDEPGNNRKIWKSFEHYLSSCDSGSGGLGSAAVTTSGHYQNVVNAVRTSSPPWSLYSGSFGAPGHLDDGIGQLYIPTAAVRGFINPPSGLDSLIIGSLRAFIPRIREELSLVNSVIELKDFASLKGTIRGLKGLKKLKLRKGRRFSSIREMLRVAADVYLQNKFNIQPLISDIRGIYLAVAKVERRLNELVSRAGTLRTSHYSRETETAGVSESTTGPHLVGSFRLVGGQGDLLGYASAVETRYVNSGAGVFHAEIQYNFHYSEYQIENARCLALLDALGLNFNPQIVWNAIPWSFVIDWLIDVGQWLKDRRFQHMEPKMNIMQYLWSIRRSRTILVTSKVTSPIYYPGTGLPGDYVQSITHPVVQQTAYRRDAGLPTASSLTTSGLNLNEFTLGAALVLSRRPRRPRRI